MHYPTIVSHWPTGGVFPDEKKFPKYNPATGKQVAEVIAGCSSDVSQFVSRACDAMDAWREKSPAERASVIKSAVSILQSSEAQKFYAEVLMEETGRSHKAVLGEIAAAAGYGEYYADYTLLSGQTIVGHEKHRRAYWKWAPPFGITALFTPFNGPFSTLAKNVFVALLCGNVIVAKAHEDAPYTSVAFGMLLEAAGLPRGVYSAVQGFGHEVGAMLARDPRVTLISATVSIPTGIQLHKAAVRPYGLARVAIESGGKNAMVICDDADFERATTCAVQSAFGNAGQMCAAASRIVILEDAYGACRGMIREKSEALRVGSEDDDFVPPLINERRLNEILDAVEAAKKRGATVLTGGYRLTDSKHAGGYYMAPTVLEDVSPDDDISQTELFGPVTCLYRAKDLTEAIRIANTSSFGLTASCHTSNMHRAEKFIEEIETGVVRINGPTYGVEPQHIPFGGMKGSGNGARMQGMDALAVYAEKKFVSMDYDLFQRE